MPKKKKSTFFQPYISANEDLAQTTFKAIVLGFLLSMVMAGANAYLGLKVGLTVSASIPAAVISMAILKMFRRSNILENNAVQTAASAGESLAAGAIFTLPALILLHYWVDFPFLMTTAICMAGGLLGVLFSIPLRRVLIVENKTLPFPEGLATSEVLKVGQEGGKGIHLIVMASIFAMLFKLMQTGFKVVTSSIEGAKSVGGALFGIGFDLSSALIGVGYIVGIRIACLVFAGGVISWFLGIPLYTLLANSLELQAIIGESQGYEAALDIWRSKIRYIGVGSMVVGGVWALFSIFRPLVDGVKLSFSAARQGVRSGSSISRLDRDIPIYWVLRGSLGLAIPIFIIYYYVIDINLLQINTSTSILVAVIGVLFALIAGFLFSSVAGYMAGLVGSSNNPISGITIATVLITSLLLLVILGISSSFDAERASAAASLSILVGAIVCCAAAISGDNMQDLKAGYILGSTPYKQQWMQILGVFAAALAIAPVLSLLLNAYGLGDFLPRPDMDPAEALSAPQASLIQTVALGVFSGNLEGFMIGIGAIIAVAIISLDKYLEHKNIKFPIPVLAVAVGIYLPIELSSTMFLGGIIAWMVHWYGKRNNHTEGEMSNSNRKGILFASGLITGEALVGILLAIPFALYETTDILSLSSGDPPWITSFILSLIGGESSWIASFILPLSSGDPSWIALFLGVSIILSLLGWLYMICIKK